MMNTKKCQEHLAASPFTQILIHPPSDCIGRYINSWVPQNLTSNMINRTKLGLKTDGQIAFG